MTSYFVDHVRTMVFKASLEGIVFRAFILIDRADFPIDFRNRQSQLVFLGRPLQIQHVAMRDSSAVDIASVAAGFLHGGPYGAASGFIVKIHAELMQLRSKLVGIVCPLADV